MIYLMLLFGVTQVSGEKAAQIDEIVVSDLDETITLRANGTAEYRFRGRPNDKIGNNFITDERVGYFTAKLDPRLFQRLVLPLRGIEIDNLKDHYVPYAQHITRINIVHDGRTKKLELNDRNIKTDPEPPDRLWTLEMAARGLGSTLTWEPIKSGVRVRFKSASKELRDIVVREAANDYPVVIIRTQKEIVDLPILPGKYSVEIALLRDGRFTDAIKTPATVESGELTEVMSDL